MKIEDLYNKILLKSRNSEFYNDFNIKNSLQNKVLLFLIHFSFIFNKIKKTDYEFNQKLFDYIFKKIELDLREIGFGDMSINKKMKILVTKFYSILLNFNNFISLSQKSKIELLSKLIELNTNNNPKNYNDISKYFNNYSKSIDLISINDIYKCKF